MTYLQNALNEGAQQNMINDAVASINYHEWENSLKL